jgi:hypothetical protein
VLERENCLTVRGPLSGGVGGCVPSRLREQPERRILSLHMGPQCARNDPAFSVYNMGRLHVPENIPDDPEQMSRYLLQEFRHYPARAYPTGGQQPSANRSERDKLEAQAETAPHLFANDTKSI